MEFDAIVGNPPYQIMDGGHGSSSAAIYDKFVGVGKKCKPKYLSMIIPSRWFSGGKGLDAFRTEMITDRHIRVLHDYMKSGDCFPTVQIEGGICYFVWDKNTEGMCCVVSHTDKEHYTTVERYLSEDNEDIFIRNADAVSILKKIKAKANIYFGEMVLPRNPFGVFAVDEFVTESLEPNGYCILGRFNGKRQIKYLNSNFIVNKNNNLVDAYKVFVSKADGAAGQIGNPIPAKIIGRAELGKPKTICTETFLAIGPFADETATKNVIRYMTTKFFRFCVGIRKNKNMTRETYNSVPMQEFTANSNIDWSKPIPEIDAKLYEIYNLTNDEISFIESMIKPME